MRFSPSKANTYHTDAAGKVWQAVLASTIKIGQTYCVGDEPPKGMRVACPPSNWIREGGAPLSVIEDPAQCLVGQEPSTLEYHWGSLDTDWLVWIPVDLRPQTYLEEEEEEVP